jgi:hypothetical protein
VLALRSNRRASADVPPNLSMMSDAVIPKGSTEYRKDVQAILTKCVISPFYGMRQAQGVLTTVELLARLEEKGIKNADIARTLKVTPSRITEMKKGERTIKLDEAAKLVSEFDLEAPAQPPAQRVAVLPQEASRLLVRYIAEELACPVAEQRLQEIAGDVRAFAEYVTDPHVRGSLELLTGFFDVMRLRHLSPSEEG